MDTHTLDFILDFILSFPYWEEKLSEVSSLLYKFPFSESCGMAHFVPPQKYLFIHTLHVQEAPDKLLQHVSLWKHESWPKEASGCSQHSVI